MVSGMRHLRLDLPGVRDALEGFPGYRTYVSAPQADGIGRGLVRRHDAAMNHMTAALRRGPLEPLDVFAARTNLFRGILAEGGEVFLEGVEALRTAPAFVQAAREISGAAVVEPTMLFANVLVPGQELPVHTDTPAFVGLDQTCCPEWLLVVMGHSGLFTAERVPLMGAVAFFGGCTEGGALVVYAAGPDAPPTLAPAEAGTAVVFDSEACFHGVGRVGGPDAPAPPAEAGTTLAREADGRWVVRVGDRELARYSFEEIRLSVQWKGRCVTPGDDRPALLRADAEARLVEDLRRRGVVGAALPDDTQLALRMIETYVRFPDRS